MSQERRVCLWALLYSHQRGKEHPVSGASQATSYAGSVERQCKKEICICLFFPFARVSGMRQAPRSCEDSNVPSNNSDTARVKKKAIVDAACLEDIASVVTLSFFRTGRGHVISMSDCIASEQNCQSSDLTVSLTSPTVIIWFD